VVTLTAPPAETDVAPDDETEALCAGIALQDADCLARLYDRLSARVFGVIVGTRVEATQAEATLLEVFHEVWLTAAQRPAGTAPVTWILDITRRRIDDRSAS
jgi:RNA polymerase sigma-70 factor, ECF subfamily